jgi:hypothetical protein
MEVRAHATRKLCWHIGHPLATGDACHFEVILTCLLCRAGIFPALRRPSGVGIYVPGGNPYVRGTLRTSYR